MIYTLISDLNYTPESDRVTESDLSIKVDSKLSIDRFNSSEVNNEITLNKRDCRVLRQPLSLLPEEIEKFIEDTKNPLTRAERRLAYTTLLSGIKLFFDIDGCTISKTSDGKPYLKSDDKSSISIGSMLIDSCRDYSDYIKKADDSSISKSDINNAKEKYQKNEDLPTPKHLHQKNTDFSTDAISKEITNQGYLPIYISISHSDGVVAVCISDEGEVGVDIQSEIAVDKADRLEKRFLSSIKIKNERLNVIYYFCNISDSEAVFTKIDLLDADITEFVSRWSYAESILKLYGKGFGDLGRLNELAASTRTEIKNYQGNKKYAISTAIQRD